jgi:hypothetical protein
MSRNRLLLTVAAVTLVIGTGGAFAQQELNHKGDAQKSAPAAQKPSGAVQQNQNRSEQRSQAGQQGRHETSGQAPASNKSPEEQKTNQPSQAGAKTNQPNEATENKEPNVRNSRTGQNTRRNEDQRSTTGQAGNETNRLNRTERGQVTTPQATPGQTTVNEGRTEGSRTNVNVELSPEQRTRIRGVLIKERGASHVANVDFSLTAGTRVPRSIHLVRVPRTIFAIEPAWRGFDYFLVGDDIVVVNPRTLEIVAVIPA